MEESIGGDSQEDSPGGDRERPWYKAAWVVPVLLVLAVAGGVGIGFGLASDSDTRSFGFEDTTSLFVEEGPVTDEFPSITDCELEIIGWIDHLNQYPNVGQEDLAFHYGIQSQEFRLILDQWIYFRGRAIQIGGEQAWQEVLPAIAAFCGVPID